MKSNTLLRLYVEGNCQKLRNKGNWIFKQLIEIAKKKNQSQEGQGFQEGTKNFREQLEEIRKSTKIISIKILKIGTYMEKQ